MKASGVDHNDHKLYYMDTQGFQGPMTQLIKAAFHTPSDPFTEFMQLDDNSRFDCSSLPNMNSAFSEFVDDGIDLPPHEVCINNTGLSYFSFLVLFIQLNILPFCIFLGFDRYGCR